MSERFPDSDPRPRPQNYSLADHILICLFIVVATLTVNKVYQRSIDIDEHQTLKKNYTFWTEVVSQFPSARDLDFQLPTTTTTITPFRLSRRWPAQGSTTTTEPPPQSPISSAHGSTPALAEPTPPQHPSPARADAPPHKHTNITRSLVRLLQSAVEPVPPSSRRPQQH